MKTVFILFDSLNRSALSCYNQNNEHTPNFERLASRGVTFDNHYAGSLPCMPARRDLLTGRLNFLHRSWGPIEPFDVCFPTLLGESGIYIHLISDHYHYWEEGGCGYHNRYSSAEFVRGQERDLWKAMVKPPAERFREQYHPMLSDIERRFPNMVNREFIRDESDYPIVRCVDQAAEFLALNGQADDWLLQLELFDPHEPFTAPKRFRDKFDAQYEGPILDWPLYDKLDLTEAESNELVANYHSIVAMCDEQLGRILDIFDRDSLWSDTAIVLTTDHGFLLGEHDWWGKNVMPVLDPIAHIPLIIYHPEYAEHAGQHRTALTQCLDIPSTLMDIHLKSSDAVVTEAGRGNFTGQSLLSVIESEHGVRDFALFGIFGGAINITDGRHTYFRYPVDTVDNLYEYTLLPIHPTGYFTREEFSDVQLIEPIDYTNGYPLLKIRALDSARRPPMQGGALADATTVLYDLQADPGQHSPLQDLELEEKMLKALTGKMQEHLAPQELMQRFGL